MNAKKYVFFSLFIMFSLVLPLSLSAATPIQRIPISDALFVGPTEVEPTAPVALHSINDFENYYGRLTPTGPGSIDDLWISARSFFEQGGETIYIVPLADGFGPERYRKALNAFALPSSIGLFAAPGYGRLSNAERYAVAATLINGAETSGHGFAILEHALQSSVDTVLLERERFPTRFAALYTPWIEYYYNQNVAIVSTPPSGTMAGVIAKSDIDRGAYEAPAGMTLIGLSGLSQYFTDAEVELLATNNVNPLRQFPPSDYKVWGARTLTYGTEGRYISSQRYGSQLDLSIRLGTEWVTAETNSEALWLTLRAQIETFLHGEWLNGALVGTTPEESYYVRCDQSTMSAEDISAGRTICVWGVSLIKPAEFSVFTLTQERSPNPVDTDPPTGYTLLITEAPPSPRGEAAIALHVENSEIGSRYQYYIGSTGGPEVLHSEGDVTKNNFTITVNRISTLADGKITVHLALTDTAKNLGPWVSATTGNTFNWSMFLPAITIKATE